MKVMMLGASGAGKTTYMACMYKEMAKKKGWCIRAKNQTEGECLEEIASGISNGHYPEGNAWRQEYKFKFQYNYRDGRIFSLFEFTWFDYRGGAIYQDDKDPVSEEVNNQLKSADALIVFIDASTLDSEEAEKQWRRIKNLCMIYTSRTTENNPLSLNIVLTKFDALKDDQIVFKNKREKTIDYVKTISKSKTGKSVVEFLKTFSKNDNLRCLLAWTAINNARRANINIPFCHAMLIGLEKKIKKQLKRVENLKYEGKKLDKRIDELREKILNRPLLKDIWEKLKELCGGEDLELKELVKKYDDSTKIEDRLKEEIAKCKEMISKQENLIKWLSRNCTGQNGCVVF